MLSKKAKYALRALMVLAKSNRILGCRAIAEQGEIPRKFLETIFQELRFHGLVTSTRGILGGYHLAKRPSEISVGQVVRIIDGPLAPIRCASLSDYRRCDDCVDEARCEIRRTMLEVRNAISDVLDKKSLADMLGETLMAEETYREGNSK